MKLPKLKYYYYAMTSDAYIDFAVSRELKVDATLTIDVLTGQITGTTILVLADSVPEIDEHFRRAHNWTKPVYILRIPAAVVDRRHLKRVTDHLYEYQASMSVPHCGVERMEYNVDSGILQPKPVAEPTMHVIQL